LKLLDNAVDAAVLMRSFDYTFHSVMLHWSSQKSISRISSPLSAGYALALPIKQLEQSRCHAANSSQVMLHRIICVACVGLSTPVGGRG
jgi:hypothetical protein